jgi:type III pantothenate kinase
MKLLIDLGNTRLKWARWDGAELSRVVAAAHAHDVLDFGGLWQGVDSVDAVWIASVAAPARNEELARACLDRFGVPARYVRSSAQACGVRNAYAQPERLGVDRFLALIGAHAQACEPTVIVSCGTALTLDALTADGTHLGGLITASPDLVLAALRGGTANLAAAPPGSISEIANNTADAMESGAWLGAAALVERFIVRAGARLSAQPACVITGGGAARLTTLLSIPHRVDTELVLRGLARIADTDA